MKFLITSDILAIHEQITTAIGGATGLREPGLLASIVDKPKATFGGDDLYPTLFAKAATIFEALCNYHVFVDGNKRTAALSLYRFLYINNYDLSASNIELEKFTLGTAMGHPDLADVASWIKKHSKNIGNTKSKA